MSELLSSLASWSPVADVVAWWHLWPTQVLAGGIVILTLWLTHKFLLGRAGCE